MLFLLIAVSTMAAVLLAPKAAGFLKKQLGADKLVGIPVDLIAGAGTAAGAAGAVVLAQNMLK